MDTVEGNILINEFIGVRFFAYKGNHSYKKTFKQYSGCQKWIVKHKLEGYAPEIGWGIGVGNYHRDWKELIPVIEKIESLQFYVTIATDRVSIEQMTGEENSFHVELFFNTEWHQQANPDAENKLHATWLACVQFIQWLNTQQQSSL